MSAPKVILITGISRGIGRAMCLRFAALGHSIIGCARDASAIAELDRTIGGSHILRALDVRDDRAVGEFAEIALAELGPPDLLINNAGLMNRPQSLEKVPPAEFADVLSVNVIGVYTILRHFLPKMLERKRGVIVNMSSGWGRSVSEHVAPYCASKFAVEGLTRALAEELPKSMAAIPLSPGIIDTDMLRLAWSEGAAEHPSPEEWVERAAPFLLKLGPEQNGKSLSVR